METGEKLLPQMVKKAKEFGGEKITLEQEEYASLNVFDEPGMQLLGFKPRSALKDEHHVRSALFLYPDEKVSYCRVFFVEKVSYYRIFLYPDEKVSYCRIFFCKN